MIAAPAITAMRYRFSPPRLYFVIAILPWLALLGWLASVSWFLTDDAFISFRYARNLLEGHGLVFNPGERVEGYSNFLWTVELAAIWGVFGVRPEYAAPWLSVAFTAGTLAVLLWWALRTPALAYRRLTAWMAVGLVCSSATFAVWTSGGGLETRQFTFFIVMAVVCLARHRRNRWGLLTASLSLAAAALTRPEGPLIAAICIGWYAVQSMADAGQLRPDWRGLAYLVAPCALIIIAHFLLRYAYYGEWLPNTYYAKFVRPWYELGFRYLWAAALETGLYLLLPLAWVGLRQRWRECRDGTFALVLLLVIIYSVYVMRNGGDIFEFRPLDFYWPLLALPAATGIVQLGNRLAGIMRTVTRRGGLINRINPIKPPVSALLILAPVLFYANTMQAVLLFEGVKHSARLHAEQLNIELTDANYGWLRAVPGMSALSAISYDLRTGIYRQGPSRFTHMGKHARRGIDDFQPYQNMRRQIIPDDAVMVIGGVGVMPYYVPDLTIIDKYGLTDAAVARNPVSVPNRKRGMAHDRRLPPGYLAQRGVNIAVFPAANAPDAALQRAAYTVQVGPDLWMPFDSHDPQWVRQHFGANPTWQVNRAKITDPAAVAGTQPPAIRSTYDVYHLNHELIYVKHDCQLPDLTTMFFLHITPTDPGALSPDRQAFGFDNRDFNLGDYGVPSSGTCARAVGLPEYPIAAIKTGQYNEQGRLWEGEIRLVPQ